MNEWAHDTVGHVCTVNIHNIHTSNVHPPHCSSHHSTPNVHSNTTFANSLISSLGTMLNSFSVSVNLTNPAYRSQQLFSHTCALGASQNPFRLVNNVPPRHADCKFPSEAEVDVLLKSLYSPCKPATTSQIRRTLSAIIHAHQRALHSGTSGGMQVINGDEKESVWLNCAINNVTHTSSTGTCRSAKPRSVRSVEERLRTW